ncbi:MAG: transporter [Lysobacterales bacterium]|jgi:hypothetical protein
MIRACLALVLLLVCPGIQAQELSPRAYWPAPVGTQVLVSGYAYASGDVLLDPTLPIYGVDSRVNTLVLGYVSTFALWNRNATVLLEAPYSWGSTKGLLGDTPARADFAGLNDLSATLSINLVGAAAMTAADFQAFRKKPTPVVGVSVKVVPPTGHYKSARFINVSGNRWAARAQLGAIFPLRPKWLLELDVGAWLFGDDEDYPGGRREQDPIYAFEAHLVHRLRPGLWASLDVNWFTGGQQTIDGEEREDLQSNARLGGTLAFPFRQRHAIKLGYSQGIRTRIGNDSKQILMTYQFLLP